MCPRAPTSIRGEPHAAAIRRLASSSAYGSFEPATTSDRTGSRVAGVENEDAAAGNTGPAESGGDTSGAPAARATFPEITRIYRITGEDCFLLDLHVADAERLETTVDSIARLGPVMTSLVLREYPASGGTPPG